MTVLPWKLRGLGAGLGIEPFHVISYAGFERKARFVAETLTDAGEIGLGKILVMGVRVFDVIRLEIRA